MHGIMILIMNGVMTPLWLCILMSSYSYSCSTKRKYTYTAWFMRQTKKNYHRILRHRALLSDIILIYKIHKHTDSIVVTSFHQWCVLITKRCVYVLFQTMDNGRMREIDLKVDTISMGKVLLLFLAIVVATVAAKQKQISLCAF